MFGNVSFFVSLPNSCAFTGCYRFFRSSLCQSTTFRQASRKATFNWRLRVDSQDRGSIALRLLSARRPGTTVRSVVTSEVGSTFSAVRGFCSGVPGMQRSSSPTISFSSSEGNKVGGKYAILMTGYASNYTTRLYGGYAQMFVKLLGDPHDIWDVFAVVDGQFPAEECLDEYDGFVVTGSRHDAHGSEEWISKLCSLLCSLHEKKRKTLGVCFGHQVLSRALGGKTGRSPIGWELGVRNVCLTDAIHSKSYGIGVPPVIRVLEVHQDQVSEVPPGAELLGSSEYTSIEIFAIGEHVLGIQGHPEFSEDVVHDVIETCQASGILKEEEAKSAKATLVAGNVHRETLQQLCKAFLKRSRSC